MRKNKWKSPAIVVSLLGLIVSGTFNYVQFQQNKQAFETARIATAKAEKLQDEKRNWIGDLKSQLKNVERQIDHVKEELKVDNASMGMNDMERSAIARSRNYHRQQLDELNARRTDLSNQLSSTFGSN